jgi:hypothetical protein
MNYRKLRFSLRWLLAIVTLVAFACAILLRPTLLAHQFVARVNRGDFSEADALGLQRQLWSFKKESGEKYAYKELRIEATVHPNSWRDILQLRRRVSIDVQAPDGVDELPGGFANNLGVYVFVRLAGPKFGGEAWE